MSNVRQIVVKLPRVADDTCCGVHDLLQLRRSNQQGVGYFGPKFRVFPGAARTVMLGLQRANVPG